MLQTDANKKYPTSQVKHSEDKRPEQVEQEE